MASLVLVSRNLIRFPRNTHLAAALVHGFEEVSRRRQDVRWSRQCWEDAGLWLELERLSAGQRWALGGAFVGFERGGGEDGDGLAPGGEEGAAPSCGLLADDGERGGGERQARDVVFRGEVVVVVVFFVEGAAELNLFGLMVYVEGYALLDAFVELDAPPLGCGRRFEAGECAVEGEVRVALAGSDEDSCGSETGVWGSLWGLRRAGSLL